MQYLSLSMSNLFSFVCPIFNATVQFRTCLAVRDKVYRGDRLETRRGCQACMSASKCPAAEIVRRIAFGMGDATDHCSSTEAKVGKLPADTLERIRPVLVPESILNAYHVPSAERMLIASAVTRIDEQMATAPRTTVAAKTAKVVASAQRSERHEPRIAKPAPVKPQTTTHAAAASGDLAAAINAA